MPTYPIRVSLHSDAVAARTTECDCRSQSVSENPMAETFFYSQR
jgi:hypothetical protein